MNQQLAFSSQQPQPVNNMQASHLVLILGVALAATANISQATQTGSPQQQVSVQTSSGLLMGQRGQQVHRFLGVPYAQAPVGRLRFQRPQELGEERRQQLVDASHHAKTCPQFRHLARFVSPLLNLDIEHQTDEDCLHLSLYVPSSVSSPAAAGAQLEPSRQLPVLVWLPGEGFDFADARQFDGAQLAHKSQAVVAVVQYRVGPLGFLHAPQLNITGNMGLHDQLMALRWLRRNLQAFGGDPDRVTLMGRFSGSMSISALLTAPKSRQLLHHQGQSLFQRAGLLSGVAVPSWIIDEQPQERFTKLSEAAAKLCQPTNANASLACLQELPVEQLMRLAGYGWRPVRDDLIIGHRAPLEAAAANQIVDGLEAVLLGETAQEGTLCLYRHLLEDPKTDFARQIQENQMSQRQVEQMIAYDAKAYFGLDRLPLPDQHQARLNNDTRQAYLEACSHYMVKIHNDRLKRQLLARNRLLENRIPSAQRKPLEVYHYELRYKPSFSLAPDYIKGAAHGDDVPLLFGLIYNQPRLYHDQRDLLMTRKMMSYVANFVHGNSPLLGAKAADNELVSMEDQELVETVKPAMSFASEASLDVMDLGESELSQLEANKRPLRGEPRLHTAPSVRLILWDSNAQQLQPSEQLELLATIAEDQPDSSQSKSRRLIELHRQQMLENSNVWWHQISRRQPSPSSPPSQPQTSSLSSTPVNESSFMTLFVFSSCTILFILMSICLGLCLLIVRYNMGQRDRSGKFASVSSCNICDDSRQSIEAALQAAQSQVQKKDGREFGGNVFAKFQQHQNRPLAAHSSAANQTQHRSAAPRCTADEQQPAELEMRAD